MFRRINLSNPILFWLLIVVFILLVVNVYSNFQLKSSPTPIKDTSIEKQSYQNNIDVESINLDEITSIDIELEPEQLNNPFSLLNQKDNLLIFLLIIYSIGLSLLFTYREKMNSKLIQLRDEKYDKLQIDIARKKNKENIYDDIEHELIEYKEVLSPELNLDNLDEKIKTDANYILFSSRVVLEKLFLKICKKHGISTETLSAMIMILFKKRIIDIQTNSYAHIIKAFGNKVAHPNITEPILFDTKDVLLVLSTLLTLLKTLQTKNLLDL